MNNLLSLYSSCLAVTSGIYFLNFIYLISPINLSSFTGIFNTFLLLSGELVMVIFSWSAVRFAYYFHHRNEKVDVKGKAVLITGCDSGFGHITAKRLDKLGLHVFATVLDIEGTGASQLRKECSKRLKIIKMDLRNYDEIQNVVSQVENSGYELWALVNNAGIGNMTFFEFDDERISTMQATFDVNFFGPTKLIKLLLPMLRQSKGRIVNMSSVSAHKSGLPTWYSASKHALRSLSNCLRAEVAPFGVKVICIEPGAFMTNIIVRMKEIAEDCLKKADKKTLDEYQKVYGDLSAGFGNIVDMIHQMSSNNFDMVVSTLEKAVVNKYPKMCYRVAGVSRPIWDLMIAMPDEMALSFDILLSHKCFNMRMT